jgi:PhnB protein
VSKPWKPDRRTDSSTDPFTEQEIIMTQQVRPIPEGFHTLTPHLICSGAADALTFYTKAFGAVETSRMPGPNGKLMHAQMRVGDSVFMLADDFPDYGSVGPSALKNTPVYLHLYVEDVDAAFARAVEAGAKPIMPVSDMFWGDRYGQLEDPFGHRWSIATHKRDMTPEQMRAEMEQSMGQGSAGAQS